MPQKIGKDKERRLRALKDVADMMREDGYDLQTETISFKLPLGYFRAASALAEASLQDTGEFLSDLLQVYIQSQYQSNFDSSAYRSIAKAYFFESKKSRRELEAELKALKSWENTSVSVVERA